MFTEELSQVKNPALRKIAEYLKERAALDALFAPSLEKEKKSLGGCWNYILSEARKKAENGCACLEDEEVFNMAVHYYDEDDIKVSSVHIEAEVSHQPVKSSQPAKSKSVKKKDKADGQMTIFDF